MSSTGFFVYSVTSFIIRLRTDGEMFSLDVCQHLPKNIESKSSTVLTIRTKYVLTIDGTKDGEMNE